MSKMYEGLEKCEGSFNKFHWNNSNVEYHFEDSGLELKSDGYIYKLNGVTVSDSVVQALFETKIYPQFLQDKKEVDKLGDEIKALQLKIDDIKRKYEKKSTSIKSDIDKWGVVMPDWSYNND